MLSKRILPSLTASTIVAKLSSVKTISADDLATSVPLLPMAQPISADDKAGASFTPSPVIATMCPCLLSALTIFTLCSGNTLAKTDTLDRARINSSSLKSSISSPVRTPPFAMDSSSATAIAVLLWSPVIIITLIPAFLQSLTAPYASFRKGSESATMPMNVRLSSLLSGEDVFLAATAITRLPFLAKSSQLFLSFSLSFGDMLLTFPFS